MPYCLKAILWRRKKTVKPAELVQYPFILQHQGSDEDANRVLNSEGLKPNVRFRVRGDEAIQSMIAKGLGVSIAPELVLSRRPEGIVLRPFEPEYHRVLGLALPENGGNAPALKLFMDFVKSYCEKERTGSGQ